MDKLEQRIEKLENRVDAIWRHVFNSSHVDEKLYKESNMEKAKRLYTAGVKFYGLATGSLSVVDSNPEYIETNKGIVVSVIGGERYILLNDLWAEISESDREKYITKKGDIMSHSMYKGLAVTVIECTNEREFQGVIIKEYSGLPQLKLGDIIVVCNSRLFKKV